MQDNNQARPLCERCGNKMYYAGPSFGGIRNSDGPNSSLVEGHYKCWNCGHRVEDEPVIQMAYRELKQENGRVITEIKRSRGRYA